MPKRKVKRFKVQKRIMKKTLKILDFGNAKKEKGEKDGREDIL